MRRTLMVAALAAALSVPIASAAADSGTSSCAASTSPSDTYLTYFGCDNLFQSGNQAPQVRIGSKGAAPLGKRSFGLLVPGSGTASGPVHLTDSVAATTGQLLRPRRRGRLHRRRLRLVRHRRPRRGPGLGRARRPQRGRELDHRQLRPGDATPGSCWTPPPATRSTTAAPAASPRFTRAHGDGPGYMLAGFGCDGGDFSIDALRYGSPGAVTTYDLEGLTSTNAIIGKVNGRVRASGVSVRSGTEVTLVGTADDGTGADGRADGARRPSTAGGPFKNVGEPGLGRRRRLGARGGHSRGDDHLPLVPRRPRATPATS